MNLVGELKYIPEVNIPLPIVNVVVITS
jgi:hypothetical protein